MLNNTDEIKSRLDIVDIIQEYVPLKQSGLNFKAPCPFHQEKTPSFMVSREKQFFKCFGCGKGGDIFTFIQEIENIEFPEALKILADKAGVELKQQAYNPQFQNLKTKLYDLHKVAVDFYQQTFWNSPLGKNAREYIVNQRGLSKEIINEFQIGYAPDSWDQISKFLRSKGFSDNEIKQSGLVAEKSTLGPDGKNYYDRFRDRIMFPIRDHNGNIVGFTGRTMKKDEPAKYLNTPQTTIYNKSLVAYGLYKSKMAIKEKDLVIMVEGQMDTVASYKAGVKNVVSISGTSLTGDQIRILKRYTKNVALCFDADVAGVAAAERGIEMLWQEDMKVKVVVLPQGIKDPDELIKKSPAAWQEAVDKRVDFIEYLLQANLVGQDLSQLENKIRIAEKIITWLVKLSNPLEQDFYLKELAKRLDIEENSVRQVFDNKKPQTSRTQSSVVAPTNELKVKNQIDKRKIISQRLMSFLLTYPEFIPETINALPVEWVDKEFQEFYKNVIFYYNKDNEFKADEFYQLLQQKDKQLLFIFDSLKLLASKEFEELERNLVYAEFNASFKYLQKINIFQELKILEQEIKVAEQQGNRQQADESMKKFSDLSRKMVNL